MMLITVLVLQNEDGTKVEYRVWNPFRSKLAAAVLGGVDNIWIVSYSYALACVLKCLQLVNVVVLVNNFVVAVVDFVLVVIGSWNSCAVPWCRLRNNRVSCV